MPREIPARMRHHGDLHLGQVLVAENDFVIVDFEGEPARPMQERRAKGPALRDLAGMLRSLDYARWSALATAVRSDADAARLEPLAATWLAQTRRAFVEAYRAAAPPESGITASGLLALFELEKALYELRYEIGNRPDWVRVPLRGLAALLGH
jgi:maltose alpha-D-glucosyltransferase/alpha-amylase